MRAYKLTLYQQASSVYHFINPEDIKFDLGTELDILKEEYPELEDIDLEEEMNIIENLDIDEEWENEIVGKVECIDIDEEKIEDYI